MGEKRGRKWVGYVIIEVLLVIPILLLLFVLGQFVERERERQQERLEQSESSEESAAPRGDGGGVSVAGKRSAPWDMKP